MKKLFLSVICIVCALTIFATGTISAFATQPIFGYDISEHNGNVDFEYIENNGKEFVMIRIGYSTTLDKYFWNNIKKANDAGISFGLYHYSYAYSVQDAKEEAQFVINTLSQLGEYSKYFTLPVAYDIEEPQMISKGLTKAQITNQMTAFCDMIRAAGYRPMVYANLNWLTNYIDLDTIVQKDYKIWYAYWSTSKDFSTPIQIGKTGVYADMWQYIGGSSSDYVNYDENIIFNPDTLLNNKKWVNENGNWYLYVFGEPAVGWQKVGNYWYYMNDDGIMQTGWVSVKGVWYYLNSNGRMLTGWQKVGNYWYYMNSSGAMQTGWQQIGGKWYYLNSNGRMLTSWQKVGNAWYYMNSSGVMQTGWIKLSGKWYYLEGSGRMRTANLTYKNKVYRFYSSGICINP